MMLECQVSFASFLLCFLPKSLHIQCGRFEDSNSRPDSFLWWNGSELLINKFIGRAYRDVGFCGDFGQLVDVSPRQRNLA